MNMNEPQPQQKSWWGRNWVWVVPVGCLLPLVLVGGCTVGVVLFVFNMIKSSDVYVDSLNAIRANADVQAALGEPITPGIIVAGNVQMTNNTGHADFTYDVSGPKGSATVHVVADLQNNVWNYTKNQVTVHSNNTQLEAPVVPLQH
jgi:hypothetical protein